MVALDGHASQAALAAPAILSSLPHPLLARAVGVDAAPARWFVDLPLALQPWWDLRRIRLATCPWRGCARYISVFSIRPDGAIGDAVVGWAGGIEDGPTDLWWDDQPWCWFGTEFLTASPGSNQAYTSLIGWNNSNNFIECLGAAASGGRARLDGGATIAATGGGGGAYQKHTNFSFAVPGTTQATYQVGAGGAGGTTSTANAGANGAAGGDTWFDGATYGAATVGAKGGSAGTFSIVSGSISGVTGGQASSGRGNAVGYNGGGSGSTTTYGATGGGGAGGPNGAGGNSPNVSSSFGDGGAGDNGSGGAPGAGGDQGSAPTNGAAGAEWDATHGTGGGGGGALSTDTTLSSAAGGAYGAGSGGAALVRLSGSPSITAVAAAQGLIVLTYAPPFGGFSGRPVRLGYLRR